jgi:hypothetical protein
MHAALALAWMAGCSTEYGVRSLDGELPAGGPGLAYGTITPVPGAEGLPPEQGNDAAPNPSGHEREIDIGTAQPAEISDYLFVLDPSSSMYSVLSHVLDGFEALREGDGFPRGARIGVMSALPADPLRPAAVHPRARQRWWLQFTPGFQSLVDEDSIAVFREVAPPHISERYASSGCAAWFGPTDVNDKGVPCIVANTQIPLYPVLVEAGLLAVHQRLQQDTPLFRSGAAVNVIFVSDTHDPGLSPNEPGYADLVSARPNYDQLRVLALSRQPLASFRVHAVAPADLCADEDWRAAGDSYFAAARASGGQMLDVCSAGAPDYVNFVRRTATEGALPQAPVIALSESEEVVQVLVDGEPARFAVSPDGRAVTLPGQVSSVSQRVKLVFRPTASAQVVRR